jgi:hypothetical protein
MYIHGVKHRCGSIECIRQFEELKEWPILGMSIGRASDFTLGLCLLAHPYFVFSAAQGKQCQAEEEEEDEYDDCGKKLRGGVWEETDGFQREKGEKCTDIQQEDEKEEEFFFEEEDDEEEEEEDEDEEEDEEEEEEEEEGGEEKAERSRSAAKIEAGDLGEELELLIREDEELCTFRNGKQQQEEEHDIQQVAEEMEEEIQKEETHGPRWALNRFLEGVEASMHRADDVEKKFEEAVSRHVLNPVEGVIDSAGGGVEEGSGMRKVATAIERTLEPVEDAIDSIENWVGGFVNTRVSPVLSWAAAWGDRRVQQLESYLDGSPSIDPQVPIALQHRQQHVHAQ